MIENETNICIKITYLCDDFNNFQMHELSLVESIISIVKEHAERNKASRVTEVEVNVGSISGVLPDALSFAWEFSGKDTIIENSVLKINIIEPMVLCHSCGIEYKTGLDFICPNCNSTDHEIIHGDEFTVNSITIE